MAAFNIRYVRTDAAGGNDGLTNSDTGAWTLAEAVTNCAAGMEIRVINDATYTSTAANTTIANVGTSTDQMLWIGRNAADTAYENAYINKGAYILTISSHFIKWAYIDVYSTNTSSTLYFNADNGVIYRSKIKNGNTTATTGSAIGLRLGSSASHAVECYAESSLEAGVSTGTAQGAIYAMGRNSVIGCRLVTHNIGINTTLGSAGNIFHGNLITGDGEGYGIYYLTSVGSAFVNNISHNTIYNFVDGIYFTNQEVTGSASPFTITNNLFHTCSNLCVNVVDSTNKPLNLLKLNKYYNCGGLSNTSTFYWEVENEVLTEDPFTSVGSDYTLNSVDGGGLNCKEQDIYPALSMTWNH
jgi:hypothetical protein